MTADSQTRSALWSFDPLAVSGSETVVMLKGAKGAVEIYGTDSEEAVLSLSDGLVLGLPEGAHCGIVDVLVEEEEEPVRTISRASMTLRTLRTLTTLTTLPIIWLARR